MVGHYLKILRKRANQPQTALAKKLDKSQSYVSRVENGKILLSEEAIDDYLVALDVDKSTYEILKKTHDFLVRASEYQPPKKEEKATNSVRKSKEKLIQITKDYFKNQAVKSVYIFGSVARDEHTAESDLDIMLAFKDDYKATLFDLIGFKQDLKLLTNYEVDIVQLGTAYPHVQASFERDKIAVYG
ncbi:MAG: nucleotidyltransferase domain-containing protein [Bacteroidota bacterium]